MCNCTLYWRVKNATRSISEYPFFKIFLGGMPPDPLAFACFACNVLYNCTLCWLLWHKICLTNPNLLPTPLPCMLATYITLFRKCVNTCNLSRVWIMEVAIIIKKQSPLAIEKAIKLLHKVMMWFTQQCKLVSLTRPLSPGHLSIRDCKRPLQTSKNAFN